MFASATRAAKPFSLYRSFHRGFATTKVLSMGPLEKEGQAGMDAKQFREAAASAIDESE